VRAAGLPSNLPFGILKLACRAHRLSEWLSQVDYVHNLIQPMLAGSVFNQQGDNMDTGSDVPAGRLHLRPVR
jgi:hypothetical protein